MEITYEELHARLENSVRLTDLIEIDPDSAGELCPVLRIVEDPSTGLPRAVECTQTPIWGNSGHAETRIRVSVGRYRLTSEDPLTTTAKTGYRKVDIRFTTGRAPAGYITGEAMRVTSVDDRSTRAEPGSHRLCIRLIGNESGHTIGLAGIDLYHRFRLVRSGPRQGGGFFCSENLVAGDYLVNAQGSAFQPIVRRVHVPADRDLVEFTVEEPHQIPCRILDPGGLLKLMREWSLWIPEYPEPDGLTGVLQYIHRSGGRPYPNEQATYKIINGQAILPIFPSLLADWNFRDEIDLEVVADRSLRLRFSMKTAQFLSDCEITLPTPSPAEFELQLDCPKASTSSVPWPVWRENRRTDVTGLRTIREDFEPLSWESRKGHSRGRTLFASDVQINWGDNTCTTRAGSKSISVVDGMVIRAPGGAWCGNPLAPPPGVILPQWDPLEDRLRVQRENRAHCIDKLPITHLEREALMADPLQSCDYSLQGPSDPAP